MQRMGWYEASIADEGRSSLDQDGGDVETTSTGENAIQNNELVKIEMGRGLLEQGLCTEAVCRILGLSPDMLPETIHRED